MLYCCEAVRLYDGMTIREVVRGRELAGSETAHSREYAPIITPGVVNSKYIRVGEWEIKTGAHRS